jgi:Lrp/AsnC family transcriptional regulator for asnA, asnC and gidA
MLDETDRRIIELLQEDSSQTYAELAKKLMMKESTVRKRVLALRDRGVIKRFTIIVDPSKMGLNTIAIVGIDADPSKFLTVARELARLPETRYVATSTGDHMIMAEIWARDGQDLSRIISEKVGVIDGVLRVCPSVIFERIKG